MADDQCSGARCVVDGALDAAKGAGDAVVDGAKNAGKTVVDGAKAVVDNTKDAITGAKDVVVGAKDTVTEGVQDVKDAADTMSDIAGFWSDPFGNIFRALQDAAHSLATDAVPGLTHTTTPDLTQEWWVSSYAVSFALAIFVMAFLTIPALVSAARGRTSGQDVFEMFTLYVPLFLAGAMFGPPAGIFLVKFFGAVTDVIVKWGIASSADEVTERLTGMLDDGNGVGVAGGVVVGIFLMLMMLLGLFLVVIMLIVQLLTLYMTGVLFPLGWVWIMHRPTRVFGYKILWVWVGILAAHPVLFFLLGVAYRITAEQVTVFASFPGLDQLVSLVVAILALLAAGLSPLGFMKFGGAVMPMGANSQGPSMAVNKSEPVGDRDLSETTRRSRSESTDAGVEDSRSTRGPVGDGVEARDLPSGDVPSTAGGSSVPSITGAATGGPFTAGAASTGEAVGLSPEAATEPAAGASSAGAASGSGSGAASSAATASEAGAGAGAGGAGRLAAIGSRLGAVGGAVGAGVAAVGAGAMSAAATASTVRERTEGITDMTTADVEALGGENMMEGR